MILSYITHFLIFPVKLKMEETNYYFPLNLISIQNLIYNFDFE
jgi:hypothetical protein